MTIKAEDIMFWILVSLTVGTALWLLHGSPTDSNAIIAVALFVTCSEVLIWRSLFSIDKRTAVGFEKMKNNMDNRFSELKYLIKTK